MLLAYYGYVVDATKQYFLQLASQSIPSVDKLKMAFLQWHGLVAEPKAIANMTMLYLKLDLEPAFSEKSKERLSLIDEILLHVGFTFVLLKITSITRNIHHRSWAQSL